MSNQEAPHVERQISARNRIHQLHRTWHRYANHLQRDLPRSREDTVDQRPDQEEPSERRHDMREERVVRGVILAPQPNQRF
jgi:hypothetical protein